MGLKSLYWLLAVLALLSSPLIHARQPQQVLMDEGVAGHCGLEILNSWDVLGPFRLGTREAVWGADPAEYHGGVQNLKVGPEKSFHSPLNINASVQWTQAAFKSSVTNQGSSVDIHLGFDQVDWDFAQRIYGWSALQYQAWAKGTICNHDKVDTTIALFTENILEYWVNDQHVFGGDFFGFGNAPLVVDLHPGLNNVSIRLLREVRSMGGILPAAIEAKLEARIVSPTLEIVPDSVVLPDVVDRRFCSRYGSMTVRNHAKEWLTVRELVVVSGEDLVEALFQQTTLAPGQTRTIKLEFDVAYVLKEFLDIALRYSANESELQELTIRTKLTHVEVTALQKITFLHPSGAVSYATLRPPLLSAQRQQVPIILVLHGAGVEVDGTEARHAFDGASDLPAWILSPTGMTPWSGDDWHTWGFADAQAALRAVPTWVKTTGWRGPEVYTEQMLVAGHSNGGQGTWYFATHQPDQLLGAVAASGYSSIENYVPFVMWSEGEALQDAILHASRNSYRHELLVDNLIGVPVFQQHGSADDNVPAYHSRLMNSLLAQTGQEAEYSEIPGGAHWFDGAMTTETMVDFYHHHLDTTHLNTTAPDNFTFVVPNSQDVGSKYGIVVDQLSKHERLGKVVVSTNLHNQQNRWHLKTENIHRFHMDTQSLLTNGVQEILIDDLPHPIEIGTANTSFVKSAAGTWGVEVVHEWRKLEQRYGRQRGALDAMLRSSGPFEVVYDSEQTLSIAVQTSRNFLQYFGADTNIVPLSAYDKALNRKGNIVSIHLGTSVPPSRLPQFPITVSKEQVTLTLQDQSTIRIPWTAGLGGVWLRPLPDEGLELVVWGVDKVGLRQAARLIPTVTGAGVPDFVVMGNQARWKGHAGTLAMGFLDHDWRISSGSYLP